MGAPQTLEQLNSGVDFTLYQFTCDVNTLGVMFNYAQTLFIEHRRPSIFLRILFISNPTPLV